MDPLSLGVGALAAAFGIARAVGMFRRTVNGAMFTRIAIEQINKGNIDRVRRVCRAVPHTSYPRITDAAIASTTVCDAEQGRGSVEQTIRDAFEHAYREEMADAANWAWLAPVAIALGVSAVFLAMTTPGGGVELAIIPGMLGVAVGVWSMITYAKIRRDPTTLGNSIVDALVDHVMRVTGDPASARNAGATADEISRGIGLSPLEDFPERTVPAGVTTIAATKSRTRSAKRSDVFDMRHGNCGMCGHSEVAIIQRGPLKAYVCKGCGFAQWFADDPSSLDS